MTSFAIIHYFILSVVRDRLSGIYYGFCDWWPLRRSEVIRFFLLIRWLSVRCFTWKEPYYFTHNALFLLLFLLLIFLFLIHFMPIHYLLRCLLLIILPPLAWHLLFFLLCPIVINLILNFVYSTLLFNAARFHNAGRPMDRWIFIENLLVHNVQKGWKFLWIIVKLMPSRMEDQ